MDDHEIVDLYWQRDEHAIEATAAKYESYCMKISQNILSDRADSEENVNDTYLHAWQAMPPQRPAILSAFLGKIARNLALNRYKARSAQKRQGDAFALSLDARGSLSGPLSPMLTIESKSGEAVTVTVSDGVLTQPLYSLQEEFTSYTVSGKVQLCWTIEEPDTGTVYTLSLDGAPAVTLRYDEANGYWAAARA